MLYNIIILPIETIVDWIFLLFINKVKAVGVMGAVFGVSMAINFLALPLYNIADSLQEKERKIAKSLEYRVTRIKKAFKGDEQFMMLSTYYRQNNYHPLYVLRSSLSILIEIPFFIAAYHYLSHSEILSGASWWIFKDLGAPDEFFSLHFGSFTLGIHILPILMTLINFVSGAIYTKEAPKREKIQLYAVAMIFLILLYDSPSGLVLYWILNNTFSLVKNIVMKMKNPLAVMHKAITVLLFLMGIFLFMGTGKLQKKLAFMAVVVLVAVLPLILKGIKKLIPARVSSEQKETTSNFMMLLFSGIGMALLTGLLLPSGVIASSPSEFSFIGSTDSPLSYIGSSFTLALGFFVFWPVVIYKMFGQKVKRYEPVVFFLLFLCALANVYIFPHNYGTLNTVFLLEAKSVMQVHSFFFMGLPLVFFAVLAGLYWLAEKKEKTSIITFCLIILCAAQAGLGLLNVSKISSEYKQIAEIHNSQKNEVIEIEKEFNLSKTKENVMVLFMDRAISSYFPIFIRNFPEKAKSFDGFTYYKNSLSYGAYTVTGSPGIMGGYEYIPDAMTARNTENLEVKHEEAGTLMPKLFSEKGYEVTVLDSPWAGYTDSEFPDFSAFNKIPGVTAKKNKGKYSQIYMSQNISDMKGDFYCRKEIFNFNFMQCLYPPLRITFYSACRSLKDDFRDFIDSFTSLMYLKEMTAFDSEKPTYLFMDNETCHRPAFYTDDFSKPVQTKNIHTGDYVPKSEYEAKLYGSFCAAFLKLADYFDYLRQNGVWDNTRIIVVSDHGYHVQMACFDDFKGGMIPDSLYDYKERESRQIPNSFDSILMCKDFNQNLPLKTDSTFMTNADTLFLATEGLGLSQVNPFTGKKLVPAKENGMNVYFQVAGEINAPDLKGKTHMTIDKKTAWHVKPGDKMDCANWIPLTVWEQQNKGGNQ